MKVIELTRDQVAIVDDEDFERLAQWRWFCGLSQDKKRFYAVRTAKSSDGAHTPGIRILMHRVILGVKKGVLVDHQNMNGLDNRKQNIRICTPSQNLSNTTKRPNCSSVLKGACWDKERQKWLSSIQHDEKTYFLGRFSTEQEAHEAYRVAAVRLHGAFARFN